MNPLDVIDVPKPQRAIRHHRPALTWRNPVDLEGTVLFENPALLAGDVVGRTNVIADLGVGDRSVLDECRTYESLPAGHSKR